jgi:peptidoglycan/xylan/chitin deacetylase (PgdA/CDA1 family)
MNKSVSAKCRSAISEAVHYISFSCKKSYSKLDKAALVLSIDIDVGSEKLGEKNGYKNNLNVHDYLTEKFIGRIEEQSVPLLLQTFDDLEVPVTFAIRGQLAEVDDKFFTLILRSPMKHDIAAHSYYHKAFTGLSRAEADEDLKLVSNGLREIGVTPRSFVFPKNMIAHLTLLEKWGYLCFRGYGNLFKDGMYVKKFGDLYDIHPGLYIGKSNNALLLNKIVDVAIRHRAPLHLWFHPWNLGYTSKDVCSRLSNMLIPFLRYVKKSQADGNIDFETMRSIAEKQHVS